MLLITPFFPARKSRCINIDLSPRKIQISFALGVTGSLSVVIDGLGAVEEPAFSIREIVPRKSTCVKAHRKSYVSGMVLCRRLNIYPNCAPGCEAGCFAGSFGMNFSEKFLRECRKIFRFFF